MKNSGVFIKGIVKMALIAALVFTVSLSFHSCSKNNNGIASSDSSFMTAKISAVPFTTAKPGSASAVLAQVGGSNYVNMNGLDSNNEAIQISLINVAATGTFAIGTGLVAAYYYPSGGFSGTSTYASSGYITVTSLSPYLTGTFSFTLPGNVTVAGGIFSIKSPL